MMELHFPCYKVVTKCKVDIWIRDVTAPGETAQLRFHIVEPYPTLLGIEYDYIDPNARRADEFRQGL